MAADIFAKIGDIKGESLDDKHKDEVELLSWSWGVSQGASPGSSNAAGKASFNDFSFTHRYDKASPNLMKACATGTRIKEATITVRKAGKKPVDYMIFKFHDVLITNVLPNSSSDGGIIVETRRASVLQSPPGVQAAKRRRFA